MFTRYGSAPLIAALLTTSAVFAAPAHAVRTVDFDIPAQPLERAINMLSRQAGVQIFFPAANVAGLLAPAVSGRMNRQEALRRLIQGTNLTIRSDDGKTVILGAGREQAPRRAAVNATPYGASLDQPTGRNDDIVVTANRRAEKSQQVAAALTVVGGDRLQERNIETVNDLENSVPSLEATAQLGTRQTQFAIRGIGLTDYAANNTGTVGVYIDEVNHPYAVTFQGSLFDIDHVEVLRGPQGTLFGRNTTAGVVSVKTNDPTGTIKAGLDSQYGRFNEFRTSGFVSGPLSDTLAARLAFNVEEGGAWQVNRNTGEKLGDSDQQNVRLKLRWSPDDRTQVHLSAHYDRDRSDGLGLSLRLPFQSHNFAPVGPRYPADTNARKTGWGISPLFAGFTGQALDAKPNLNNEGFGGSIRINHDFGGAELTAIIAHESFDRKEFEDFDATSSNEGGEYFHNKIHTQSEELRLASPSAQRFRWLAGAYRSDEKTSGGFMSDFSDVASLRNIFAVDYDQVVHSTGAFGDLDYDLTDKLTLTIGGRYEHESRYLNDYTSRNLAPVAQLLVATNQQLKTDQWSGKAEVDYHLTPDALVYAQISRGVKSGGFTTYNSGLPGQIAPFQPEKLLSYEVGLRSEFFDHKVRVNASAFYYDYRDQQLQGVTFTQTQRIGRIINVPRSHIYGGELELTYTPTPALQITQSVGYKAGAYDEYDFVDSAATVALRNPATGNYDTIVTRDQSGDPLPNFPRFDYKGSATYTINLGEWSVTPNVNYNHRSSTFLTTANIKLPAYWLVNANLMVAPPGGRFSFGVYVRNATDERFYETANAFVTAATYTPHEVRSYGARLSWRY